MCSNNFTPTQFPLDNRASKNINFFFNGIKTITSYLEGMDISRHIENGDDGEHGCPTDSPAGVTLKHISNLSNMSMCCNSWKRVGLINVKRTAGLVTPAKLNYSD